MCKYAN